VRGVKLAEDQSVNALIVAEQDYISPLRRTGWQLTRSRSSRPTVAAGRASSPSRSTDRNGRMVGALHVTLDDRSC